MVVVDVVGQVDVVEVFEDLDVVFVVDVQVVVEFCWVDQFGGVVYLYGDFG